MQRAAIFASATPVALATNGTVREARGFTSSRNTCSPWIANCVFIRPTTFSARASSVTWRRSSSCVAADSEYGGSEQDESPECTPASSICSITPPISTLLFGVGDHVDVDLAGVVEEAVEQHRRGIGHAHRVADVARQVGVVVDDLHRAAAEHVARAHHQRVADLARQRERLVGIVREATSKTPGKRREEVRAATTR